jgi:flagellar biosynthesis protein FlhB
MSMFNDEGKTEAPTPRRRSKAREEGSVAKSAELNSAVVLITASLMMIWFGSRLTSGLGEIMKTVFRNMCTVEVTLDSMRVYMWEGMKALVIILAPIFGGIMIAGVVANVGQVGFKITTKAAHPKWTRLNPMTGFKRLFSMQSLMELGKAILKMALVGGIVYSTVSRDMGKIFSLGQMPAETLGTTVGAMLGHVFLVASLSLIIIGILDYFYNRFELEKSLKMTKEEIKEESRMSEGDPKVKSKIREIMFKASFRRMMKKVPEADVVIANPIHLAVALKYDRKRNSAPIVVAKGARKVAERIKQIARDHGIPVIENPPLARALFKAVDIDQEVPVELYKAVAEVLAYVYRLKKKFFGVA